MDSVAICAQKTLSFFTMVSQFFRFAFASPFVFPSSRFCRQVEALGVHPAADTLTDYQLLGDLSVLPKVTDLLSLATWWAVVFQRVRYLVLFSLFFLMQLFKKFWSYPFEDRGGGFCIIYLWGTLLAMVGSRDHAFASISMMLQGTGKATRPGHVLCLHPCVNS